AWTVTVISKTFWFWLFLGGGAISPLPCDFVFPVQFVLAPSRPARPFRHQCCFLHRRPGYQSALGRYEIIHFLRQHFNAITGWQNLCRRIKRGIPVKKIVLGNRRWF